MIGKQIRMERVINRDTGCSVIVPLDHGLTVGPIPGLVNMRDTVSEVVDGGINAVLMHKGHVTGGHRGKGKDVGLFIHLSGATVLAPDPNKKVLVATVEEAIKLGADGVSIHINLGAEEEAEMLKDFGKIGKKCQEWGMPLLAMMYTRGDKVKNEADVEHVKLAARVANELGADIVKVTYTGDAESFARVVEGVTIPVLIAGGEKAKTDADVLRNVKNAIDAGGKGVSIGRNVFQHSNPRSFCKALSKLVHDRITLDEALLILNGGR